MTMENMEEYPKETMDALSIIRWSAGKYGKRALFACSFSAEDMAILHMISICRDSGMEIPEIITLDTGRLHEETYTAMQDAKERYRVEIKTLHPDSSTLSNMVTAHGPNLFYKSAEMRQMCCNVRKTIPLNSALENKVAWITGLRREQSPGRSIVKKISSDPTRNGITKINPIADWTTGEIWAYIKENKIPYNKLHDMGFPSIGCEPCTRPIKEGEDIRAGRWWWEDGKKECGIHETTIESGQLMTGRQEA